MLDRNRVQLVALPGSGESDPCIHVCQHFALEWLREHVVRGKKRDGSGEEKERGKTGEPQTGLARFLEFVGEDSGDDGARAREREESKVVIRMEIPCATVCPRCLPVAGVLERFASDGPARVLLLRGLRAARPSDRLA